MLIHIPWLCYACGMQKQPYALSMSEKWAIAGECGEGTRACVCVFVHRICFEMLMNWIRSNTTRWNVCISTILSMITASYGLISLCGQMQFGFRCAKYAKRLHIWRAKIMLAQHRKYTVCIPCASIFILNIFRNSKRNSQLFDEQIRCPVCVSVCWMLFERFKMFNTI